MRACRSRSRLSCRGRPSRFASVSSLRARRHEFALVACFTPRGVVAPRRHVDQTGDRGEAAHSLCQRCSVWQWRRKDCGVLHETLEARLCGRGSWRSSSRSMCTKVYLRVHGGLVYSGYPEYPTYGHHSRWPRHYNHASINEIASDNVNSFNVRISMYGVRAG